MGVECRSGDSRLGFRSPLGRDDLKDVAVGISKEKPLKGGFSFWLDEFGSIGFEFLLDAFEFALGKRHCHVPTEFLLVAGGMELRGVYDMKFLVGSDLEPGRVDVDVSRTMDWGPAERLFKEAFRRLNISSGEGEVCKSHDESV